MLIGNAYYQCSCVQYVSTSSMDLIIIVAASAGGVALIIIAVGVGVCVYIRHKKLAGQKADESGTENELYSRQLPDGYDLYSVKHKAGFKGTRKAGPETPTIGPDSCRCLSRFD